jgi:CheY-like chemotaxis protein
MRLCQERAATALQIVLAEDDALVALVLADCLQAAGHNVMVAKDGGQALEVAQHLSALDLLITDLRMPNLSGESLIRALWAERPGLPVLVVTGSSVRGGEAALRKEIGLGGPLALRYKPLGCASLVQAVHSVHSSVSSYGEESIPLLDACGVVRQQPAAAPMDAPHSLACRAGR